MEGCIYKMKVEDDDKVYIGSTFNRLSDRFRQHKYMFKRYLDDYENNAKCAIYPFFKKYGIDNFTIILIKEYRVCDKKHLQMYEQLWLSKLTNINVICAFQPLPKQQKKQYRENNKDKLKLRNKRYSENQRIKKKYFGI
jgi:hypothetical protein